jgi:hypothetical protein
MALPVIPQTQGQVSDEQLIQLAQQTFPKLPLARIMEMIQKFKSSGMTNEQIIQAAQYIEEQGQMGGKMMPNLKQKLMGP